MTIAKSLRKSAIKVIFAAEASAGRIDMERYTYFDGGKWRLKIGDTEYSGDWVDRLAAYEETGLEPEELAQAKKEGRLVVLPCSVGDPVFMGTGRYKITGYEEDVCDGFYIGRDGILQVKAQNYNGNHGTYGVIGQTAELTREAAEAALNDLEAEHDR